MKSNAKKQKLKLPKNQTTKWLAFLIAMLMVVASLPLAVLAEDADEGDCDYLSVSYDGVYIDDKNGSPMVYLPVPLEAVAAVDLSAYGLEHMRYDADGEVVEWRYTCDLGRDVGCDWMVES